ncbi:MAG: efflux RND transporter periplasmic adaptor subunit [Planktomarina sp.]
MTHDETQPTHTSPGQLGEFAQPDSVEPAQENSKPAVAPLQFDTDRGAAGSTWIALILLIAIVGWMGSGFILPSEGEVEAQTRVAPEPVSVAVATSVAETVTLHYQAEGQALPDRDTVMRAETSGDVVEVLVEKGQDITAGQVIARFDATNNTADANRAAEDLAEAQRELTNAEELLQRGVATTDRVVQARSRLASALAQVTAVEQASKSLSIRAPFAGRIETFDLDEGEFVSVGTEVGRIVDITPLTVAIQVPQQSLTRLKVGQPATVQFITGEQRQGTLTFVGTSAAAETRTFLAEVEVKNADGAIPAGISAEISIPTGTSSAHFLSPSIVSLNTDGDVGVKTVDGDNKVAFFPIEVVKAQIDGIWVTGLPDTVDIITVGQGFVSVDEIVQPRPAEANQ